MSTRYAAFALLCLVPLILLDEFRLFARTQGGMAPFVFDPLPSFLGTIGFVFLAKAVVPDRWRMASMLFVAAAMLSWEFAQRFAPLSRIRTFDWLDVWAGRWLCRLADRASPALA